MITKSWPRNTILRFFHASIYKRVMHRMHARDIYEDWGSEQHWIEICRGLRDLGDFLRSRRFDARSFKKTRV